MKKFISLLTVLLLLSSCVSKAKKEQVDGNDWAFEYAKGITVTEGDGYYHVNILDPWKNGHILHSYVLVPKDAEKPDNMPKGTLIRIPLTKSLVYSSVHAGLINELKGSYAAIGGVCDAQYYINAEIKQKIADGVIKDCGSSLSPTIETIIELEPDAILLSPFQNAGYGALEKIGIPIMECADYMENTPLGRAEWIRFFALLYGEEAKGDSIFQSVKKEYLSLKELTAGLKDNPKVITENVQNGVWYVPGGNSYMAHLLIDAGAEYPWKDDKSSGSLQLDFTQVYDKAFDADIWLIKSFVQETYESLGKSYALNKKIKAYKDKNIYMCNTRESAIYDEFPFHPERLLKDYISIFHPEILPDYNRVYFNRITE